MAGISRRAAASAFVLLLACGGPEAEQEAVPEAPPTAAPGSSLAEVAGTWNVTSFVEATGDTVTSVMVATPDPTGWTLTFPGREPLPLRVVEVGADSFRVEAGPYESVLNSGVQVRSEATYRLQDGLLTGTFVSHRTTTGPDSVLRGRSEARRSN
jgi:hypothetical protein